MDRDEALLEVRPQPVRLQSLRLRSQPRVADDSVMFLASLVGGAIIGSILALL